MHLTMLGTGVGIPQPGRSQSSLLVVDHGLTLLLDCGAGTLLRLSEIGLNPCKIDAVFLTHLHLDHVSDVLALAKARWLMGQPSLQIFGPPGTKNWYSSLSSLYPYLSNCQVSIRELEPEDTIKLDGLEVKTAKAVHSITALALRLEGDRSLVYSGDTEPVETVANLARGSDILVHECSFPEPFVVTNHSTPIRLGSSLKDVRHVILTHFYPETIGHEEEMAEQVAEGCGCEVKVGCDLMEIVV